MVKIFKRVVLFVFVFMLGFGLGFGSAQVYKNVYGYTWKDGVTFDEVATLFENGGSGIYYFGYDTCPWCQSAEPIIQEVGKDVGVKINHVIIRDHEGKYLLTDTDRKILAEKMTGNGFEDYWVEPTDDDKQNEAAIWSEDSTKVFKFFVPTVMVIKNGNIISIHCGTVESQESGVPLTDEEATELMGVYREMFEKVSFWGWFF